MIISDENSNPIYIESIDTPTLTEYFWTLNLSELDYMLQKLEMFEELTTSTLSLQIGGYVVIAPTNWNMLIFSQETSQLDVVEMSYLSHGGFQALTHNIDTGDIGGNEIVVVDYNQKDLVRTPLLNKNIMLCHHLGPKHWVCLAPTDNYNKFLKDKVIGDLME